MDEVTLTGKPLIGIKYKADIRSAAGLMAARDISALGVYSLDGHDLLGIVTERDITRAVAGGADLYATKVEDIMNATRIIDHLPAQQEAISLMRSGHVRHLVVTDNGSDRMVSIRDLLLDTQEAAR